MAGAYTSPLFSLKPEPFYNVGRELVLNNLAARSRYVTTPVLTDDATHRIRQKVITLGQEVDERKPLLSGAGLGWAASVGSAGCRFGSIGVTLRVSTDLAGGVECITPARKWGKVDLAVASDLRLGFAHSIPVYP